MSVPEADTVCVLALDAADYELAQRWDCRNLLLENHDQIQTFAHSKDEPYTPEVWATVATGVGPEVHGIGEDQEEVEWDNPLLRLGSRVTRQFPPRYRQALGRPFRRRGASQTFQEVADHVDHPFDASLSWPGLGEAEHLREMWRVADRAVHDDLGERAVAETFHRLTGQEIGYLATLADTDARLVGAHAHVLDIAGHLHASEPDKLREWYEWVDQEVGRLRRHCDRLVVLSDHGMQTTATGDAEPGSHSWRAYIATQGLGEYLPESVFGVRQFLEGARDDRDEAHTTGVEMDTPTETLQDLGYLS